MQHTNKIKKIEVNYIKFIMKFEDKHTLKTCSDTLGFGKATCKKIKLEYFRPENLRLGSHAIRFPKKSLKDFHSL